MRKWKQQSAAMLLTCTLAMAAAVPAQAAQPWSLENGQYVDASGNAIAGALAKGITVTKYQNRATKEGIDWTKVAADGVNFAMVRLGYFEDKDPYFDQNVLGATAAGLKVGAFFYTQALDTARAEEEARFVLRVVKDFPISYPIAYDVESQHLLDNGLTPQQITDNVNAFCKVIADAGYRPIVYADNNWLTNHMDSSQIPYDIWYARYGTINNYQNRTIWQCTDSGSVNGINGNVTIELSFTDYTSQIPANAWHQIDGNWYYMENYRKKTGWLETNGTWYYLDSNGILIRNTTMTIDGVAYTFDASGAMI